jgi:hypothetical protein
MIAPPINDHACLGPTTDQIVAEVAAKNPAIVDLAARFATTDDLAAWFRIGFELWKWTDSHGFVAVDPRAYIASWANAPASNTAPTKEAA